MEGFRGKVSSRKNLRVNLSFHHPRYIIVILEEGNKPHPRCPKCYMSFPQEALNQTHLTSVMCWRGTDRKRQRLVVEETEELMVWEGYIIGV